VASRGGSNDDRTKPPSFTTSMFNVYDPSFVNLNNDGGMNLDGMLIKQRT